MARGAQAVLVCLFLLTTSLYGLAAPPAFSTIRVGSAVMASTGAPHPAGGGAAYIHRIELLE